MDRREANRTRQLADNAAGWYTQREKEQEVRRSKMQPPSTIPCQYEALVGYGRTPSQDHGI
jgi:hypothetical protein